LRSISGSAIAYVGLRNNPSNSGSGEPPHKRTAPVPDANRWKIGAGTSEIRRILIHREIFTETA
jgi:hypothetical protein